MLHFKAQKRENENRALRDKECLSGKGKETGT